MVSHLHARKKGQGAEGVEDPSRSIFTSTQPQQQQPNAARTQRKRSKGPSEVLAATFSVCGFLLAGLCLAYFLLHHQHRKVILHVINDPLGHGQGVIRGRQGFRHHFYTGHPRYVTVVMPSVVNAKGRRRRLNSIQDTWGGGARAIYVVYNVSEFPQASHAVMSENSSPLDRYAYPQLLLLPSTIGVDNGVARLIHTIRTIHDRVDPDFAFFVNDHTFVIPAHLCKYLDHRLPGEDMYEGHALRNGKSEVFNSGAAGYLLSRSTMQKLIQRFDAGDPKCVQDKANEWLQNNPGLVTMQCLASLDIRPIDTRAANKWHRFHAFPLTRVVSGEVDEWFKNKHKEMDQIAGFPTSYNEVLDGEDCCSMDTISFHYVEWKEARALFAIQELLLEHPHMSDHEVKLMMQSQWPSSITEIGFYSKGLPKDSDSKGWQSLIATVRKISSRHTQREC
ncbi:hypothetical protein ACA910_010733 [Epithemia clementina (nom. ined.)]